jgi:hypothetical protein
VAFGLAEFEIDTEKWICLDFIYLAKTGPPTNLGFIYIDIYYGTFLKCTHTNCGIPFNVKGILWFACNSEGTQAFKKQRPSYPLRSRTLPKGT